MSEEVRWGHARPEARARVSVDTRNSLPFDISKSPPSPEEDGMESGPEVVVGSSATPTGEGTPMLKAHVVEEILAQLRRGAKVASMIA